MTAVQFKTISERINKICIVIEELKTQIQSITSDQIIDGTISAEDLSSSCVTTTKLANLSVTNAKIAADAITYDKISDDAVINDKIQDNAISTAKLQNSSVTADKILDRNVTNGKIALVGISTDLIANLAVTNAKINDVSGTKITTATIPGTALVNSTIENGKYADLSITDAKIMTLDGSKIVALSISDGKISDFDGSKLTALSVTDAKIAGVDGGKLVASSVFGSKLANSTVTNDKLGILDDEWFEIGSISLKSYLYYSLTTSGVASIIWPVDGTCLEITFSHLDVNTNSDGDTGVIKVLIGVDVGSSWRMTYTGGSNILDNGTGLAPIYGLTSLIYTVRTQSTVWTLNISGSGNLQITQSSGSIKSLDVRVLAIKYK